MRRSSKTEAKHVADPEDRPALLVVSHGSSADPNSYQPLIDLVAAFDGRDDFRRATVGFLKQAPSIAQSLAVLASAPSLIILPYLASAGYFATHILPKKLGFGDLPYDTPTTHQGRTIVYAQPLGTMDGVVDVVLEAGRELGQQAGLSDLRQCTLMVVGHGTPRHRASGQSVRDCVAEIKSRAIFGAVVDAFVDEAPTVAQALKNCPDKDVLVLPYFVCDGPHVRQDIPAGLGIKAPLWGRAHAVDGHRIWYGHAVLSDPTMADVILANLRNYAV